MEFLIYPFFVLLIQIKMLLEIIFNFSNDLIKLIFCKNLTPRSIFLPHILIFFYGYSYLVKGLIRLEFIQKIKNDNR